MKTKTDIKYKMPFLGRIAIIPKGTKVIHANNLPEKDLFWAEQWENMNEYEESHYRNYGFLLTKDEVEI